VVTYDIRSQLDPVIFEVADRETKVNIIWLNVNRIVHCHSADLWARFLQAGESESDSDAFN
jgi:hypothetical protein